MDSLFLNSLRQNLNEEGVTDLSCIQRFIIPLGADPKNMEEGMNVLNMPSTGCSAKRRGCQIVLEGCNLTGRGVELPTINPNFRGKKLRFVYSAGTFNKSEFSNKICKTDLETRETKTWNENEYLYPGEPFFIPRPGSIVEDDGIVISALTDSREGHDDALLFLDASTFTEVARTKFKTHVPSSLHGLFLSNLK
jgi:hypothetical protein